jgi:hypothetical protein
VVIVTAKKRALNPVAERFIEIAREVAKNPLTSREPRRDKHGSMSD